MKAGLTVEKVENVVRYMDGFFADMEEQAMIHHLSRMPDFWLYALLQYAGNTMDREWDELGRVLGRPASQHRWYDSYPHGDRQQVVRSLLRMYSTVNPTV